MKSTAERYWPKVERTDDCWIWRGATLPNGYGTILHNRKTHYAHRVSFALRGIDIPEGMTVDHLCRNRACVNPKHLEIVTLEENLSRGDGIAVRNSRKSHCPSGHELSGSNLRPERHRACRACHNEAERRRRARRR